VAVLYERFRAAGPTGEGRRLRERGDIVLGWLVKLALILAVVGVIAYDTFAIAYNHVATSDDARSVADAASDVLILKNASKKVAIESAEERAESRGVDFSVDELIINRDGSVQVTVHRSVDTIVTKYLGPLSDYTTSTQTYTTAPLR